MKTLSLFTDVHVNPELYEGRRLEELLNRTVITSTKIQKEQKSM